MKRMLKRQAGRWIHRAETLLGNAWRAARIRCGLAQPVQILAYRGFGTHRRLWLRGRALEQTAIRESRIEDTALDNLRRTLRWYLSAEIPHARIACSFQDQHQEVACDPEGYFEVEFEVPGLAEPERRWQEVRLDLRAPFLGGQQGAASVGFVLVPSEEAAFGVISDVDDTIVHTGATNLLRHARVVLFNNARSRLPFAGVAAFYRALERGPAGRGPNPVFYLSSSPWNLYDLFTGFMEFHDLPSGPILLKDFGFSEERFFKASHFEHKLTHARRILELYPRLPFVLLGDTGQKDAEIYATLAAQHPGRIRAIYLREVVQGREPASLRAVRADLQRIGVPFVIAPDTAAVAAHAADLGLIDRKELPRIRADRAQDRVAVS